MKNPFVQAAYTAVATHAADKMRKAYSKFRKGKKGSRGKGRKRSAVRRRAVSRKRVVRRRRNETGEWDYSKKAAVYGRRPRKTLRQAHKLIVAGTETVNFVTKAVTKFGGANGAFYLNNMQTALGAALVAPCYMWDITSAINIVNNAVATPVNVHRLQFTNETDTSLVQWYNSAAWNWAITKGPETSTGFDNYPQERSLLKWANLKLMLYAPTALPTKFQIEMIQFRDERLVPSAPANSTGYGGVAAASSDAFTCAFYQYFMKKFMYNQIEPQDSTYRRYYRVLKRMVIYCDPKDSTDGSNTRYKEVNFFANLNRIVNYRWNPTDRTSLIADDTQIDLDPQNSTTPHPRSRIFFCIRAVSGYTVAAAPTNTVHPSMDWFCRTCHSTFN